MADVNYGAATITVSKDKNVKCTEDSTHYDLSVNIDHSISNILGQKQHLYYHKELAKNGKLEGTYYICIEAKRTAYLIFGVFPVKNVVDKDEAQNVTQGLVPGQSLMGEMSKRHEKLFFSFPVNFVNSDERDYIAINLTPLKGKYALFVRADGGMPNPTQGFWTTEDNSLVITPSDPEFKNNTNYIVGVELLSNTIDSFGTGEKFQFNAFYTFNAHHVQLKPAIFTSGKFPESTLFFSIEVSKEMDSIVILKSQGSVPYDMHVSISPKNSFPDAKKADYIIGDIQSGLHLNKVDLDKLRQNQRGNHAIIYIGLEGKANTEYGITYNYNDLPFTLNENKPLYPPMMKDSARPLKFITYVQAVNKRPFIDVQAFNAHQAWDVYITYGEGYIVGNSFPEKKDFKFKASGGQSLHIDLSHPDTPVTSNMMFLVALYPTGNYTGKAGTTYDFDQYGKIEAVTDLRQLDLWAPYTGSIKANEWQYFRISNPFEDENVLISVEPLSDGDIDLYVTKGLNTRPSKTVYMIKSNAQGGDEIEISKNSLIFGDKQLMGDYIVGVYGVTDSKFSLIWQHSRTRLVRASFGRPFVLNLKKKLNQYIIFDNSTLKQSIDIKFGAPNSDVQIYVIALKEQKKG